MTRQTTRRAVPFTLLMILILLAAAYLRIHGLAQWPPGISHDESINGLDAFRIWRTGTLPTYRVDGRPEPLFRYAQALTVGLFGATRFGLRMASVFTGLLSVAAAYRAARHLSRSGWVRLAAAATLAVLVGHVSLSRVAYRAILLPLAALLFFDSFMLAWKTGRRRAFVWAGAWLAVCVHSYTAGFVMVGALPLALVHQAAFDRPQLKRRLTGLLLLVAVFAVLITPLVVIVAIQPAIYQRAGELAPEAGTAAPPDRLREIGEDLWGTWQSFSGQGDINPQYNVEDAPLLHTLPLYGLFLLGMAACLVRPRRLTSVLLLGLLVGFMFPVAFAGEIPHGLRIAGEFAIIPLLAGSGAGLLIWLVGRLPRYRLAVGGALALAVSGVFVHAAILTGDLYFNYWAKDIIFGQAQVHKFSWFFEGPRTAMANYAARQNGPVYLPLTELAHPPLRYLTLHAHPDVVTFAERLEPDGSLSLPAGTFVLPPMNYLTGSYGLLEPDGSLTLLPQFDAATQAELEAALAASDEILLDQYGLEAATLVRFPSDGSDIRLDPAIAYPTTADFDGQVRLLGWAGPSDLPAQVEAGQRFEFTLYLEAGPEQRRDLDIFAQVWTLADERIAGRDDDINRWLYPNSLWQAGDIVPVTLRFPLSDEPLELAPGGYRLAVGVNDAWGERVPIREASGAVVSGAVYAGSLKVPDPDLAVDLSDMQSVSWQVGDAIMLVGYRLERDGEAITTLAPGDEATLTLAWQASARPTSDDTAFFHLVDSAGDIVAQYDVEPTGGRFPTSTWDAGETYTSVHPVVVPPDASPGPYDLLAGMYARPSLERLPVTDLTGGDTPDDSRIPLLTLP